MIEKQRVDLWYCNSCSAVHLVVGKVHLSFNKAEFAEFTKMAVETNYSGWPNDRVVEIDDRVTLNEGGLCSSEVH